jgi:hypothetical protein
VSGPCWFQDFAISLLILAVPVLLSAGEVEIASLAVTQTAPPPDALHADGSGSSHANSVRTYIETVLSTLATVALQEKISRFAGIGGTTRKLDSFEAEVSVADGTEQYADVQGHHRTYHHVSEIGGLWSFGEIVTMLRTTRDIIDSSGADRNQPDGEEASDQTIIRFNSPSADHRWFVTVKGRIYWLDFEGCIRISKKTGAIESLTWTSGSGPPATGIAGILWNVNFHAAAIAEKEFTMPADSIFRVVRRGRDQRTEWNLTQYEAVGRYGSTVSVHYRQ